MLVQYIAPAEHVSYCSSDHFHSADKVARGRLGISVLDRTRATGPRRCDVSSVPRVLVVAPYPRDIRHPDDPERDQRAPLHV